MLRKVLLGFLFYILFTSSFSYEIELSIKGVENDYCRLAFYYSDKQLLKDSTLLNSKGYGVFKSKEDLEKGIYLIVLPDNKYFELLIGEDQKFSIDSDTVNLVEKLKIKGGDNDINEFVSYIQYLGEVNRKINKITLSNGKQKELSEKEKTSVIEIEKEVSEYRERLFESMPSAFVTSVLKSTQDVIVPKSIEKKEDKWFYYKEHYFDNVNFSEPGLLRTPVFHKKLIHYLDKINYQIPDSLIHACDKVILKSESNEEVYKYVVSNLTNKYANSKIMGMDKVFNHLGQKYYLDKKAWWADSVLTKKIYEKVVKTKYNLVGNKAIPFTMEDTSGTKYSLYSIQAEYTVLVFWSSTCGHCKKTLPLIKDLYDEYKQRGVKVVAVNIDKKEEEWKKYLQKNTYDWINLADGKNTTNFRTFYNVDSTPIIYLLDQTKRILAKRIDVDTLEKMLEDNFN